MNKNDIPVKTSTGLAEMKSRSLGLAPRMRTALLLVDGFKPIGELERLMAAAGVQAGTLDVLFEKGLITIPAQQSIDTPALPTAAAAASEPPSMSEAKSAREPAAEYGIQPTPELAPAPASEAAPPAGTAVAKATVEPKAAPASGPEVRTRAKDVPPVWQHAALAPIAPHEAQPIPAPAEKTAAAASAADLKLVSARAHLASALDEHVGFQSYVLKQRVANCSSRRELESLFGAVEEALGAALNAARTQAVISTAKIVLNT